MSTRRSPSILALIIAGASLARFAGAQAISSPDSVHPEYWPQGTHRVIDAKTSAFVEDLLARMSLQEKVAQMIQADIASITPDELRVYKLGAILAGGNAAPNGYTRSSPRAWAELSTAFHRAALVSSVPTHEAIPVLFGIDAVHGNSKLIGATIFPHNIALGAAHDPALIRRIGEATAAEVSAIGIDWTFAPTVAVARDPRWGRSYESYSEAPALVALYAPAMLGGLQGDVHTGQFMGTGRTLGSIKHYLGDGGTLQGRDQGMTIATETELRDVHAAGYIAGVGAGAWIIMASYNSWNGLKLHANHYLLTDILKERLAFDGFVVGDWNAQEQVPGCTKTDCAAAILAGVDMLMAPDSWKGLFESTLAEAQSGKISSARIDDAVRRILRVKAVSGLFSRGAPAAPDNHRLHELGSAEHRAIAREAVRKSLVLLKNDGGILPLNPHARILVAGGAADDIGIQCGGWTIDWQGDHNSNSDFPGATSIYRGLQAAVAAAGGTITFNPDGAFETKPDIAIVIFGEHPYAEFQGDRESLEFSPDDKHDLRLLRELRHQGIPTVSVFLSGRPLWVNPEINASDAFVAAWLPGSEGEGIADVLLRAADGTIPYDVSGRLSFSWPRTAMPVTFEANGGVAGAEFARGAGLSYHDRSRLAPLPENAGIPALRTAPAGSLFHAGHLLAPWTMFVGDEDEVHVTTDQQASPHGAVTVAIHSDGAGANWNGSGKGMLIISGRAADLSLGGRRRFLAMRYRIERAPDQPVLLEMRCTEILCGTAGGASLDVTRIFNSAAIGKWQTLSVPLSCFASAGANFGSVEAPFVVATSGRFALQIGDVRLNSSPNESNVKCP